MSNTNKPNILFWIIGIIALIWNGMGVVNYLMQAYKTEAIMAKFDADQLALLEGLPIWMTALFAIAVFAGAIGSISFLMRKKLAVSLFLVSFLAATVQQLYWLFGTNMTEVFSEEQPYLMPIMIIVFAAFLAWYSKNQKGKGVLS
ncbi:hypothetical protein JYT89_00250 [Flavobacteriaceae bacterium AH-315-B10]|nr:hypothetical protein [Flavobacteriaceae bacterium AH-315-B10]